jgi:hypothetical protein
MTFTGQNLSIYQGKDKTIEVSIVDSSGLPVAISNYTFTWVVYKPETDNIILTKTSASGIIITDAANGVIEIDLKPSDTANLFGQYNHEGEITTPANKADVIFTGYFKVYGSKT